MNTGIVTFATCGYAVINGLIGEQELAWARKMTDALVERYRSGEPSARAAGVSIGDASRQHPQRNPDVEPGQYSHEPFIIGDLVALEPGFARFLCQQSIWTCAARLLDCAPAEVLFHFSNITRKPGEIGPAVGWHRDADNRYFASDDGTLHGGLPNRSRQNRDVIVIQFGVRSSHLRAHASEAMALSSREDFLKVVNA